MQAHHITSTLVAVVAAATLAACSSSAASVATSSSPETFAAPESRVVPTMNGDVTIPAHPKRVVVLNYALAGYLYDLAVPVAATIPEDADGKGVYSDFWVSDAEEDGTEFLPWSTDGFDLEAILEAEPDVIIAGGIGFPAFQAAEVYDQLTDIAPTVMVDPSFDTWQEQFSFIANDVFDKGGVFEESLAAYQLRAVEVRESIKLPSTPVAFLAITADGTPYGLIEGQGLPEVFSELGFDPAPLRADNGFEPYTPGGDMFELSTEQVGQVVTMPTVFVLGFNADTVDVSTLRESPVYAALPSFSGDSAYDLPHWALRGDYDEALALLDTIQQQFS